MTREDERDMACTNWICSQENGTVIKARKVWKAAVEWADYHPQWIPVEEELPKKRGKYIVHATRQFISSDVCEAVYDGKFWWKQSSGAILNVTHWMPFPEAPKK